MGSGKFSLYLGEKISFWEKGEGQKYHILGKYTPLPGCQLNSPLSEKELIHSSELILLDLVKAFDYYQVKKGCTGY